MRNKSNLMKREWMVVYLFMNKSWKIHKKCFTERGAVRSSKRLAKKGGPFSKLPVSFLDRVVTGVGYCHESEFAGLSLPEMREP